MFCIVLFAPPSCAEGLAASLGAAGAEVRLPPASGARVVVAASFSESDLAAAARLCAAKDAALVAAEVPPECYFAGLLLARARRMWTNPVAIPRLRGEADFAAAAKKILAALPESAAPDAKPPQNGAVLQKSIAAAAAAARAGDCARARSLLPAADFPAARALSLLIEIQENPEPAAQKRAAEQLRRENLNLTEEEKNAAGTSAFLAAFDARRALDGVL